MANVQLIEYPRRDDIKNTGHEIIWYSRRKNYSTDTIQAQQRNQSQTHTHTLRGSEVVWERRFQRWMYCVQMDVRAELRA